MAKEKTAHPTENRKLISPLLQVCLIGISFLVVSFLVIESLKKEHIVSTKEPLIAFSAQDYRTYAQDATKIETGLYVNQFQEFDLIQNKFMFRGTAWFLFNIGAISLETLGKFSFNEGEVTEKSEPYVKIIGDRLFVVYHITVSFRSDLSYSYFPVDDHSISLTLQNQFVSPYEVVFVSSQNNFNLNEGISTVGWGLLSRRVKTGYNKDVLSTVEPDTTLIYPIASFMLSFIRDNLRYTMSILLPLLLIFYLSFFSFSFGDVGASISLAIGSVTAILAYRFIIESISPVVSYFMVSDYIFFLMLAATSVVFLFVSLDTFARPIGRREKIAIIVLLHTVVLAVLAYLLLIL